MARVASRWEALASGPSVGPVVGGLIAAGAHAALRLTHEALTPSEEVMSLAGTSPAA